MTEAPPPALPKYQLSEEEQKTTIDDIHNGIINAVSIDGAVLLQIVKHSQMQPTAPVRGILTGFAEHDYVDVTYSFPLPSDDTLESTTYRNSYMEYLQGTGYCADIIGMYITTGLTDFLGEQTLAEILAQKGELEKFIIVTYDPLQASQVYFPTFICIPIPIYFFIFLFFLIGIISIQSIPPIYQAHGIERQQRLQRLVYTFHLPAFLFTSYLFVVLILGGLMI